MTLRAAAGIVPAADCDVVDDATENELCTTTWSLYVTTIMRVCSIAANGFGEAEPDDRAGPVL